MGESPSKRRYKGRKAYSEGYGIEDCPYVYKYNAEDWKEGWHQQREIEEKEEQEKEPEVCPYCGRLMQEEDE